MKYLTHLPVLFCEVVFNPAEKRNRLREPWKLLLLPCGLQRSLFPYLPVSFYYPFVGGQVLNSHGTAGMQLVS